MKWEKYLFESVNTVPIPVFIYVLTFITCFFAEMKKEVQIFKTQSGLDIKKILCHIETTNFYPQVLMAFK